MLIGTAMTPSQLQAYTNSMYSGLFGKSRASRSPALKPWALSAAAMPLTRVSSSEKDKRASPGASAVPAE